MGGILLKQAELVTAERRFIGNLRIEGEKIVDLGDVEAQPGDKIIDCQGLMLVPGGIETHTHLQLESMGTVTADDWETGTWAALAGGTTTVLDFATQFHGESMREGLAHWHQKADGHSYIDYGFHMACTEWNEGLRREMRAVVEEEGISSFKLYMAYKDNMMVQEDAIYDALAEARRLGATIGFHCENGFLIEKLVRRFLAEGKTGPYYHQWSRPDYLEAEAIKRLDTVAHSLDAPYYVVHLSSALGYQEIQAARARGSRVIVETCPQYLVLDNSLYGQEGDKSFEAAKYVMSPPLREKHNQETLWNALADGGIQFVGTDHCSFNYVGQKDVGVSDFSKIRNGGTGIESRMAVLYSYGVLDGRLSPERYVAVTSTNAAKYFGLYPNKGSLLPETDADLVLLDPNYEGQIRQVDLHENVDYSCYEGLPIKGRVHSVFLRGRQLLCDGELLAEKPEGRYLRRRAVDGSIR